MMSKFAMISPSAQTGNRATVEFHSHDTGIKFSRGLIAPGQASPFWPPVQKLQKFREGILRRPDARRFGPGMPRIDSAKEHGHAGSRAKPTMRSGESK